MGVEHGTSKDHFLADLVTRQNLNEPEIHELLNPDLNKWLK